MNKYYVCDSDELYHWKKGQTKPGARYVARKWVNGKWKYIYSKIEQYKNSDEPIIKVETIHETTPIKNQEDFKRATRNSVENKIADIYNKVKNKSAISIEDNKYSVKPDRMSSDELINKLTRRSFNKKKSSSK